MSDFTFYFTLGIEHISGWSAFDHILFLTALAAGYSILQWRRVLVLVTAFTIGHATALALSVFNIIDIPNYWVELLIAASIVITAACVLIFGQKKNGSKKLSYALALVFGLVHGLGFATSLIFIIPSGQSAILPICYFNLGLETVQIAVVLIILLLKFLILKFTGCNERQWLVFIEIIALVVGLWLFISRM